MLIRFVLFFLFFITCSDVRLSSPNLNPSIIYKNIYVDRTFDRYERLYINQAANEWNIATKNQVKFTVYFLPKQNHFGANDILMIKVSPDYPNIIYLDSHSNGVMLGYYDDDSDIKYIEIVSLRIQEKDFKSVIMHELGHALGLQHHPGEVNLMNPHIEDSSNFITKTDIKQFCSIYICK